MTLFAAIYFPASIIERPLFDLVNYVFSWTLFSAHEERFAGRTLYRESAMFF